MNLSGITPDDSGPGAGGIVPVAGAGAGTNWCSTEDARNPAMTPQPESTGDDMITSTLHDKEILPLPVPGGRLAAALRYLMREWERDGAVDEGASETELMVLLSGMVSVSDPTLGDA